MNLESQVRSRAFRRSAQERGSILLFIAVGIIPILFFLCTLSIDLGKFFTERNETERIIDSAAVFGARYLPFKDVAWNAAVNYLQQYPQLQGACAVHAVAEKVSIEFRGNLQLSFASYFGAAPLIPYKLNTAARLTPQNVVVFFDSSSYLAPALFSSPGVINDISFHPVSTPDHWRAADLFQQHLYYSSGNPLNQRVISQQCFNSGYSALKETAIRVIDYSAAYPLNSVGVFSGPGASMEVPIIRDVQAAPSDPYAVNNASFGDFTSPYVSDIDCLSAAFYGENAAGTSLPDRAPELGGSEDGKQDQLRPLIQGPTWVLPPSEVDSISVRQAVWGHAVRWRYPAVGNDSIPQRVDAADVIERARSMLLGADYRPERAGVVQGISNTAFLLFGDLPWQGAARYPAQGVKDRLRQELQQLNDQAAALSQKVTIYYVLLLHPGNCSAQPAAQFYDCPETPLVDIQDLTDWLEDRDDNLDNVEIAFSKVNSGGALTENWAMHAPMAERVAVLSKEDSYEG